MLLHAPILQLVDPKMKFFVTTDASDFVIGVVLSQVWDDGEHPIAYESRKLNAAKGNYATHEKELLAVIHALRTWRHYLLGNHFVVVTDHKSLKYLHTASLIKKTSTPG